MKILYKHKMFKKTCCLNSTITKLCKNKSVLLVRTSNYFQTKKIKYCSIFTWNIKSGNIPF